MKPKKSLIVLYCKGEGERFKDVRCQYYMPLSGTCRLLKNRDLQEVFAKGRCKPYDRLKKAIEKKLWRYRDLIEAQEHLDRLTFEVAERVKREPLTQDWTFVCLTGYLSKAAYNAVLGLLLEEGLLVRKRCKYCFYFTLAGYCHRETLIIGAREVENHLYNQKRNASDRACEGFEAHPHKTVSAEDLPEAQITKTYPDTLSIQEVEIRKGIEQLLRDQIARAKGGEKRRIAIRQHAAYCLLIKLMRDDGLSWKEAKQALLSKNAKSKRTLERDLADICECLVMYRLRQLLAEEINRDEAIVLIAKEMGAEPQKVLAIVQKFEHV